MFQHRGGGLPPNSGCGQDHGSHSGRTQILPEVPNGGGTSNATIQHNLVEIVKAMSKQPSGILHQSDNYVQQRIDELFNEDKDNLNHSKNRFPNQKMTKSSSSFSNEVKGTKRKESTSGYIWVQYVG